MNPWIIVFALLMACTVALIMLGINWTPAFLILSALWILTGIVAVVEGRI